MGSGHELILCNELDKVLFMYEQNLITKEGSLSNKDIDNLAHHTLGRVRQVLEHWDPK